MNRNELVLFGLGGAGNRLVDCISQVDERFIPFYINTSLSDIQSLETYDDVDINYFSLSSQGNGTGRSREKGKRLAGKNGYNILDIIQRFPQKNITLFSSFGGGSGSSILSVILSAIDDIKKDSGEETFDKVVNIVGILPKLNSVDLILKNTIQSWNEIMSYNCVSNMIIIDNNSIINGNYLEDDEINERFAESFNSIFDIPTVNGRNFDTGNLSRLLNSKGCTYFYELPSGCESAVDALALAEEKTILGKMYKSKEIIIKENGLERVQCGYIGASFNDDKYDINEILYLYKPIEDKFNGYNEDKNILLISGVLPPLNCIKKIQKELEDREKGNNTTVSDFSKFIIDDSKFTKNNESNKQDIYQNSEINLDNKTKKKTLKKNLFDSFKKSRH
ncbi:hypothetical protein [Clostridium sp.]|uniref:hypothetical protein n=1 Tax=Clostridium sp. TaxID=1506 RepID=UPI002619733B|nr:hypothetical protein [Clostridium sp.]